MTKRERVALAVSHREPDRVPKGELAIERGIARALLGPDAYDRLDSLQREIEVRRLLNIDFINLHEFVTESIGADERGATIFRSAFGDEYRDNGTSFQMLKPALADISEAASYPVPDIRKCTTRLMDAFRENSDLYRITQINGPVSALDWMLGMEDYLVYCMTDEANVCLLAEKVMEFETGRAEIFIDHGADAVLIADDIAFNTGLLLPPRVMKQVAYPFYRQMIREIKKHKAVPVFLHTDGNIQDALESIVECGFDGIQSLQPSAGMDIAKVKKEYGDALCLIGNLDLDRLLTFGTPEEVREATRRLIDTAAPGGGFILSTCNILIDAVPRANALEMYQTAEEYGIYRQTEGRK